MREKDASPNSLKLLERGSRAYNLASDLLPGHPGLFGLSPFADTFPAPSLSSGAPTQSLRVIPGGRRRESITTRSSRSSRPRAARPLCPIPSHPMPPNPTPGPPAPGTGLGKGQLEFARPGPWRGFLPRSSAERRGREGRAAVPHTGRSAPSPSTRSGCLASGIAGRERRVRPPLSHRLGAGMRLYRTFQRLARIRVLLGSKWVRMIKVPFLPPTPPPPP